MHTMIHKQHDTRQNRIAGFTLIEALAVIAIIGLLSAFAIPSYLSYLAKTRVSEMFTLARPAQLGVADAFYGGIPLDAIGSEAAGITWEKNQHEQVESIAVNAGCIIMTGRADKMQLPKAKPGERIIVSLTPREQNGTLNWQCQYENPGHKPFLPKYCALQSVQAGQT